MTVLLFNPKVELCHTHTHFSRKSFPVVTGSARARVPLPLPGSCRREEFVALHKKPEDKTQEKNDDKYFIFA